MAEAAASCDPARCERPAPGGHRPRVELVPPGRLHVGQAQRPRLVAQDGRDPRGGARRRRPRRRRRAAGRADGARARDDRAVRPLLPCHRDRRRAPGRHLGDPRRDQPKDFLRQARKRSGLEIEVLSPEEEARYGYLAAVNSTTLVGRRRARPRRRLAAADLTSRTAHARDARSWPLGAVRMTERFLDRRARQEEAAQGAARAHPDELVAAGWLNDAGEDGARLAGIGGTVRNLAAAAEIAADNAVVRRPGLRARAQGARRARRALRRHEPGGARPGPGHQARAR